MINDKIASALALFTSCFLATEAFSSTPGETTPSLGEDAQKAPAAKPKLATEEKVENKFAKETGKVAEQVTGAARGFEKGLKKLGKHK